MKKGMKLMAAALIALSAVACSSYEKMVKMADAVTVDCEPAVLEVVAGEIDATVTVTYPADYFHPKAILEVTPVLVYEGGEAEMAPFIYQGVKVKDNYKVVSSEGQSVTEKVHFTYVPGMEKARLELRGVAKYKKKSAVVPSKKVADGCNTTYMLVNTKGAVAYKADGYQEVISLTEEGQILYGINSADVAGKQLRSSSIKDFKAALDEIAANERKTLVSTEVVAYASPDGGQDLNAKLSDKRSQSGAKAFAKVTKGKEAGTPEVKSIGQDWEGFQELVSKSDLEDKELILRVLSMYSDPAVREAEIKNMSQVYTALKSNVLPELRRARFIANVEYKNFTAEELLALVEENVDVLDEAALLRAATLVKDADKKISLYQKAVEKYDSDRARYNIGVVYLSEGKDVSAEQAFAAVQTKDADLNNALGVIALHKEEIAAASSYFKAAATPEATANMGVVNILNGEYAQAVANLKDAEGCAYNKTLAYILNDQLDEAKASAKCNCPKVAYLKAIIAARQGETAVVASQLEAASANASLKARSVNDVEFVTVR